jgi:hypothetical protein
LAKAIKACKREEPIAIVGVDGSPGLRWPAGSLERSRMGMSRTAGPGRLERIASALTLSAAAVFAFGAAPALAQPLSCGQVITHDTRVEADLRCPTSGQSVALEIGAPNITLDLNGHSVAGDYAVKNQGFDGVTIRNGTIDGENWGIALQGVTRNTVRNIFFEQTFVHGLELRDSDRNRILANHFHAAPLVLEHGSDANTVSRNSLTNAEGVLDVTDSNANVVVGNVLGVGGGASISLRNADHNWVVRNRATAVFESFSLARSDGNVLADNVGDFDSTNGGLPARPGVVLTESSRIS